MIGLNSTAHFDTSIFSFYFFTVFSVSVVRYKTEFYADNLNPKWYFVSKIVLTYYTLIRFGKFEEITVLMAKICNFDSNISDFNSVDLKKAKK